MRTNKTGTKVATKKRIVKLFNIIAQASLVFYYTLGPAMLLAPQRAGAVIADDITSASNQAVLTSDTGYKSPTANAQNGNNDNWTNPTNAYSNGGGAATENGGDSHRYYDFNFGIPGGSIISGIEAKVDAWSSDSSGCQIGVDLSWDSGSHWSNNKTHSLTGSEVTSILGGANDKWGSHNWLASDFTNGNFRARVRDVDPGSNCTNNATTSLDWLQVRVNYTEVEQPLPNPVLPSSCGLDMGLVIDSSGSISSTELGQMKNAFNSFVDAFLPGTPTKMSVVEFDTNVVPPTLGFTDNITSIQDRINAANSGGFTNWEAALIESHGQYDPRPAKPDLIVFASDGNPNTIGSGDQVSEQEAVNAAVVSANSAKTDGIRILALGIGNDLDINNLKAISGPNVNTGLTSDVITSNFDTLAEDLAAYAQTLCGGKILVQKQFDTDGDGQADLDGSAPDPLLAGYTFDVNGSPSNPPEQITTNTGSLEFEVDGGTYGVTESYTPNNTELVSAACQKNGVPVGVPDIDQGTVSQILIGTEETVSCNFVNTWQDGTLTVVKNVVGGDAEPGDWQIHVQQQGNEVPGSPQGGNAQGTDYTLFPGIYNVTETDGPTGYSLSYSGDCDANGNVTIPTSGNAICTLTNTRDTGTLKVVKIVDGGTALPENFGFRIVGWQGDYEYPASGQNYVEFQNLTTGTYSVEETSVTNYVLSNTTCNDVNVLAGQTVECTMTNTYNEPEPMMIMANKIVCENETDLPDWGVAHPAGSDITAATAQDWINAHPSCHFASDWKFQWSYDGVPNPGDNTGESLSPDWHTFGPTNGSGLATVEINDLQGTPKIWIREVWQSEYIPFASVLNTDEPQVSAEMYCHTDVLNYDNWEWIGNPELAHTYYCVAFNVRQTGDVTFEKQIIGEGNPDDWTFSVNTLPGSVSNVYHNGETVSLPTGQYLVTEHGPDGYTNAGVSGICSQDATRADAIGARMIVTTEGGTCTFTNEQDAVYSVTLDKTDDPDAVQAGGLLTYTLNWENTGNAPVNGLTITDAIPANTTYNSCTGGDSCGEAGGIVTWNLGTQSPGVSGSVTVTVLVDTPLRNGTMIYNNASIFSKETKPIMAYADTTVASDFSVNLIKSASDFMNPGTKFAYTLNWSVDGNSPIDSLIITDPIPANTTFVAASDNGTESLGVVTWDLGAHNPGDNGFVTVTVQTAWPLADGTEINNTAQFCGVTESSDVPELEKRSEEQSVIEHCTTADKTTIITSSPILTVIKSDTPDPVAAGGELTYEIAWSVSGNSPTTDLVVTDQLPNGLTFVSADNGGTYASATRTVTWALGNHVPGDNGTVTLVVSVNATLVDGTILTNNVTIDSIENVSVTDSENTLVTNVPALTLTKVVDATKAVNPGDEVSYTVTVKNTGYATAKNLTLNDVMPTDLYYSDVLGSNRTFVSGGDLAIGDTMDFTYPVTVKTGTADDSYVNTATLTSDNHATLTAQATIQVTQGAVKGDTAVPELSIEKTVDVAFANPSDTVVYTVKITNTGEAPTDNLVLSDILPTGLSFTETGGLARTWNLGVLAQGKSVTVNYDVDIAASVSAGNYENIALASADNAEEVMAKKALEIKTGDVLGDETGPELPKTGAGMLDYIVFGGALLALAGSAFGLRRSVSRPVQKRS